MLTRALSRRPARVAFVIVLAVHSGASRLSKPSKDLFAGTCVTFDTPAEGPVVVIPGDHKNAMQGRIGASVGAGYRACAPAQHLKTGKQRLGNLPAMHGSVGGRQDPIWRTDAITQGGGSCGQSGFQQRGSHRLTNRLKAKPLSPFGREEGGIAASPWRGAVAPNGTVRRLLQDETERKFDEHPLPSLSVSLSRSRGPAGVFLIGKIVV
jgi:hypothetical protein